MIKLENEKLRVEITELGAQLHSIKRQGDNLEYLWQGDPTSWGRQAPILFPFVGRLKNDQYEFNGVVYHQTQHGFARDKEFNVAKQDELSVTLELKDSKETREVFPFAFDLQVHYELVDDTLKIEYTVTNPGDRSLIYAIGAHPGFNMPLKAGSTFNQVELSTAPAERYGRIILAGPYSDLVYPTSIDMSNPLKLDHNLFRNDAVIFKTSEANVDFTLTDTSCGHGVHVQTERTEYVGVWSPYPTEADFVCIEPWWGIADTLESDGKLLHKRGMHRLSSHDTDYYQFSIKPF